MKKTKKIFSLLLLACMAFALTIPALAAVPTGTVTVDNAVPGEKFDFFRILQFNETTSNYEVVPSYKSTLQTFTGKTTDAEILVALSAIESGDLNIAGSNNDAKELAYALYAVAKDQSNSGSVTVAAGANAATITLPYGYYLVIPTLPDGSVGTPADTAVVSLGVLGGDRATIHNKMAVPTIDKVVTDDDETEVKANVSEIGETLHYKVTSIVPIMAAYDSYTQEIHDSICAGIEINPSTIRLVMGGVTVIENGRVVTALSSLTVPDGAGTKPNIAISADKTKIDITIEDLKALHPAELGDTIMTYDAVITKNAVLGSEGNPNQVYIRYSNNPNAPGRGQIGTSKIEETVTYTFGIELDKITRTGSALEGSTWTMKKTVDGSGAAVDETISVISGTDLVDNGGRFTWTRLDKGTYTLTETTAPHNYNVKPASLTIVITPTLASDKTLSNLEVTVTDPDGYIVATDADATATGVTKLTTNKTTGMTTFAVRNYTLTELPATGGAGLYVVIGAAVAALLGVVGTALLKKKISE